MKKTKIDWADSTWNPVTGCLHGCEYCYARRIARRFNPYNSEVGRVHKMNEPYRDTWMDESGKQQRGRVEPYSFGFDPTFHRYRLDEPTKWKKPRNIFVCSMADLFGDWVPDSWIKQVFKACQAAPQHRYMFLTKNPKRYLDLAKKKRLPAGEGFWYGTTVTTPDDLYYFAAPEFNINTFLSIEPIMAPFDRSRVSPKHFPKWVIVGAETGNRKGKVIPEKAWVDEIVSVYMRIGGHVFMKESLRELMGEDFRQEFPEELESAEPTNKIKTEDHQE